MQHKKTKIFLCVLLSFVLLVALVPILRGQQTDSEKAKLAGSPGTAVPGKPLPSYLRPKSPVPTTSLTLQSAAILRGTVGVIALNASASIKLVNPKTFVMYGPFLAGKLGSPAGGLCDVDLTSNGCLALVSNFRDRTVYFIGLANPSVPKVLKAITFSFFAEDIVITPNQKFALVTDGGATPKVASLNLVTRTLIQEFDLTPFSAYACAVAVAKDNKTVITADYFTMAADVLLMNPTTGKLNYSYAISLAPSRPFNVFISPTGKTAFVVSSTADRATYGFGAILSITGPGAVSFSSWLPAPSADIHWGHCAVFSKDGKKLYVLGSLTADPVTGFSDHYVYVYNVTLAGTLVYTGTAIRVYDLTATSDFLGVDTMAIEPGGRYLYVSNHTISVGVNKVAVVDLTTSAHVLSLIPCGEDDVPAGIAFKH